MYVCICMYCISEILYVCPFLQKNILTQKAYKVNISVKNALLKINILFIMLLLVSGFCNICMYYPACIITRMGLVENRLQ